MKKLSNIYTLPRRAAAIACLLAACHGVSARSWLITDPSQLSTNGINPGTLGCLLDDDPGTFYGSGEEASDPHYIQVDFGSPMRLADDEDIVIYTQRFTGDANPTTFRIEGSNDGTQWQNVAHAYFVYRGPNTKEYSSRIHPDVEYRYLRFTVTANSGRITYNIGGKDIRTMSMAEFNILRLGHDENYSDILVDRFRLVTDYIDFGDMRFEHTNGISDPRNRTQEAQQALNLDNLFDAQGNWTKDKEFWDKAAKDGLKLNKPDMTYLTSADDSDIKPGSGVRQKSNVMEHILYAVPGDAIALYPYYDFNTTTNYYDKFTHWYDYYTGGSNEHLDFLVNPAYVVRTDNNGYFGSTTFAQYGTNNVERFAHAHPDWVAISTADEWNAFADRVNAGETGLNAYFSTDFRGENARLKSVGTAENPYRGHFNGLEFSVADMVFGDLSEDVGGMFAWVGDGAVIENFWMYTTLHAYGMNAAGIVGAIPPSEKGLVTIRRVVGDHNVQVSVKNGGGIFGCNYSPDCAIRIEYCGYFGQLAGGIECGAIAGWTGYSADSRIVSCYDDTSDDTFNTGIEANNIVTRGTAAITNSYSRRQGNGLPTFTDRNDLASKLGSPWYVGEWSNVYCYDKIRSAETRANALIATFMVPRDVYAPEGAQQSLVFPEGRDEIVIACDVAQEFDAAQYYDVSANNLVEPTISVRHIFRIRDGKKFADENMATVDKNRRYINQNIRYVNAPAGRAFQIRFDSPVPIGGTTRSRWYYKAQPDESDYRRICSMDVAVYDEKGNFLSDDNSLFYATSDFNGYGSRSIEGIEYRACGGGGKYNRMLACDSANAVAGKTYIVRLIGKDINSHRIIIPDGSNQELWVQEFRITFLGPENASVVSEATLNSDPLYENRRPGNLQYLGELRDAIDYDDYVLLESTSNVSDPGNYFSFFYRGRRYKFRQDRKDVAYTFGYHNTSSYDYSNYNVASHSDAIWYSGATGENGLYDRKYYDTNGREHGYFFFVNACTDPGVMGRLKMGGFCLGSTVHVSAWYFEGSGGEVANLAFNFVAVLDDGERVPLHTFVSGYVPENGIWHNIYYSFIPEVNHLDKAVYNRINHYELELDNNCRNSNGADYGIDDIRVYITTPDVQAVQTQLVCDMDENDDMKTSLKVSSPFDMLLQSLGIHESENAAEARELDIYYTFIDKEIFDTSLAQDGDKVKAFSDAVLKFPYRESQNSATEKSFGHLKFYNNFDRHPEYNPEEETDALADYAFRELVGTEQWITFNTRPRGKRLRPGKEFYVVLYTPLSDTDIPTEETAVLYLDPQRDCAKVSTFRVRTAGQIKIDGKVIPPGAPIEVCEGQSPVVQLDLATQPADETDNSDGRLIENAYFDWYTGTIEEFLAEGYDEDGSRITLRQMLALLRSEYPGASDLDLCEPTEDLSKRTLDYLKALTRVSGENGEIPRKLYLRSSSFVFPPVDIPQGQEMGYEHVTAIPFDYVDDMWLVCTAPTEVTIAVKHHSPTMGHGFAEGIDYPEGLEDVPLRIGLRQLRGVSSAENSVQAHTGRLTLPVREIVPATQYVDEMVSGADPLIYLAATDDPEYRDLGSDGTGLMPVGEVVAMIAKQKGISSENAVQMVFYDTFRFKEGYRYTMRYNFEELAAATKPDDMEDNGVACKGQDSFTLIVVPEYVKWTAANGSDNWADDTNWRRVDASEIRHTPGDASHDLSDFLTDGTNSTATGFVPLDFTKVLVCKDEASPTLFNAGDINVTIGSESHTWSSQPDGDSFQATPEIQYHMAARSSEGSSVDCRPWLANECEQIHFGDRSEILGQQHLRYKRAHVEVELDPSRWYTLSSPLADIVAGDMYMPTASARQETELYVPIRFDRSLHDRFAPAVFQRSWNRAYAWVHEVPDGDEADPKTDVFVETTWSGVYNEVNEKYPAGIGFSIKVDGSTVGMAPGRKALLRLPKDDLEYLYYSDNDSHVGTLTTVRTAPAGRLNDVDGEIRLANYRGGNRFFMVGNPFMSHLDMKSFLEHNSSVIETKYWILTADAQLAAVMDPVSGALISNVDDARYVAPVQGFFVEAKQPVAEGGVLTLRYNAGMAALRPDERGPIKAPAARAAGMPLFSVSVLDNGEEVSRAVIAINNGASKCYDSGEDAAAIFDESLRNSATVYTIAGDRATAVNITPDAAGTEIGLRVLEDKGLRSLRFEGTDAVDGLSLYDKDNGTLTPLYDGMEIEIEGNARGRFFLMSSLPGNEAAAMSMRLHGNTVTITAGNANAGIEAGVYDTLGRELERHDTGDGVLNFDLDSGIYIIKARDAKSTLTRKFIVQ